MKKFFIRVEKGDTVLSLSEKFCLPPVTLIKQNNLIKEVSEGDLLYIESGENEVYKVKATDTISSICENFHLDEEKLLAENNIDYIFYGLLIYV